MKNSSNFFEDTFFSLCRLSEVRGYRQTVFIIHPFVFRLTLGMLGNKPFPTEQTEVNIPQIMKNKNILCILNNKKSLGFGTHPPTYF